MKVDIEKLKGIGKLVSYPKNFLLVKEGRFCNKLWILQTGLARYFYYKEEKEFTGWIDLEGDIVGSMFCALGLGNPKETIQLLEDSDLFEIDIDDIQKDIECYKEFKTQILEYYFLELENRIKFFQTLNGKERYEYILDQKPELVQRVPLHIISSYLGMTPESLSRIRSLRS
jgi:CRP/FNR family transcriptional regulator, anaerobic regulatory protein